jgi:hypothetical protein
MVGGSAEMVSGLQGTGERQKSLHAVLSELECSYCGVDLNCQATGSARYPLAFGVEVRSGSWRSSRGAASSTGPLMSAQASTQTPRPG